MTAVSTKASRPWRKLAAVILGAAVFAGPLAATAQDAAMADMAHDKVLKSVVDGAWRSPKDRARDAYRHPLAALTFWGLKPGDTVVDIEPGANGWWTQILAPYLKETGGTYVAALPDASDPTRSEAGRAEAQAGNKAFWTGVSDQAIYGHVQAYEFGIHNTSAIPANSVDMVLVARAFHNWARNGDQTDVYLKAFYRMLKPGGILAVEQHRAPEGSDPKAGTGYVPESYVIEAARRAGFVLDDRSEINANPKDTRDHPFGVWTLPPTRQSSASGQPDPNFDHSKYDAIGESDRMTLRFKKPA